MPHHRDPRADDRARAAGGSGPAALQLDRVAARLLDHPDGGGDRLLVADLIGAEREVADHQGGLQPAAYRPGKHEHVVKVDGGRRVVAEDRGRGGVADEHEVHARGLDGTGARVVISGDHHDRLSQALLLGEQWQGHRKPARVGGDIDPRLAGPDGAGIV